jgi:hypothetical protein
VEALCARRRLRPRDKVRSVPRLLDRRPLSGDRPTEVVLSSLTFAEMKVRLVFPDRSGEAPLPRRAKIVSLLENTD